MAKGAKKVADKAKKEKLEMLVKGDKERVVLSVEQVKKAYKSIPECFGQAGDLVYIGEGEPRELSPRAFQEILDILKAENIFDEAKLVPGAIGIELREEGRLQIIVNGIRAETPQKLKMGARMTLVGHIS